MRTTPSTVPEWISNSLDEQQQRVMIDQFIMAKYGAANCITNEGTNDSVQQVTPFKLIIPINRKVHYKDAQHLSGTSALNIGYLATDVRVVSSITSG